VIKRYEYTAVEVPRGSAEAREHLAGEMLNKVAMHGWRLHQLIPETTQ